MLTSINPATGENIETFHEHTRDEVLNILSLVDREQAKWSETGFEERSGLMKKAAEQLLKGKEKYARRMTLEMGKTIQSARDEVEKCAWVCEYYAENADKFLNNESIETDASQSYVAFRPIGVVLAVMPWNFPLWQVFRFAAPALMAGNGAVLKHASNVMGCALDIEEIFREAGFPEHLFRTLKIGSREVASVIENTVVKAVTLTGSGPAGKAVAEKAGSMLKKTVLELGGSDPYIILEDANLEKAAETCVTSRLINAGQSCIAAKRFIVVETVMDEFLELFLNLMKQKKMGDPFDEQNDLGPQARHDLRDELHEQVLESIRKGAECILGGEIPDGKGAYYPPTILRNVTKGMPAYDEELFGPVAAIINAGNEKEAIEIANDSPFGLGAAIFTENTEKGKRIAEQEIEAGCCFVNQFVKSDPRLPFGGIRESGYGRELSYFGIREFVNIKTVYVK